MSLVVLVLVVLLVSLVSLFLLVGYHDSAVPLFHTTPHTKLTKLVGYECSMDPTASRSTSRTVLSLARLSTPASPPSNAWWATLREWIDETRG